MPLHRAEVDHVAGGRAWRAQEAPALTREEIEGIRARAENATPGPWRGCGANEGRCICNLVWTTALDVPVATTDPDRQDMCGRLDADARANNAAHIAGMDPPTTLRLLAEVDRLTRERDEARAAIARVREAAERMRSHAGLTEEDKAREDIVAAALALLPQEAPRDERVTIVCGKRLSGIRACGLPPGHDNGIHDPAPPQSEPSPYEGMR